VKLGQRAQMTASEPSGSWLSQDNRAFLELLNCCINSLYCEESSVR